MPIPVVEKVIDGLYFGNGYLVRSNGPALCAYCRNRPRRIHGHSSYFVTGSDVWHRGLVHPQPVITNQICRNIVQFKEPESNNASTEG